MCGRMNLSMAEKIRKELELKERLRRAMENDKSHTQRLSQ